MVLVWPPPEFQIWLQGEREGAGGAGSAGGLGWLAEPLSAPQEIGANVRNRFGQSSVIRMSWSRAVVPRMDLGIQQMQGKAPDQPLAVCVTPDKALLLSESQVFHL